MEGWSHAYGYARGAGAEPVSMLSLGVFLTVLAAGTVLAVWALAINPATRVIPTPWPRPPGPATESVA